MKSLFVTLLSAALGIVSNSAFDAPMILVVARTKEKVWGKGKGYKMADVENQSLTVFDWHGIAACCCGTACQRLTIEDSLHLFCSSHCQNLTDVENAGLNAICENFLATLDVRTGRNPASTWNAAETLLLNATQSGVLFISGIVSHSPLLLVSNHSVNSFAIKML